MNCPKCGFISFKSSKKCPNCFTDLRVYTVKKGVEDLDEKPFSIFSPVAAQMEEEDSLGEFGTAEDSSFAVDNDTTMVSETFGELDLNEDEDFELDLSSASELENMEDFSAEMDTEQTFSNETGLEGSNGHGDLEDMEQNLELALDEIPGPESEDDEGDTLQEQDDATSLDLDLDAEVDAEPEPALGTEPQLATDEIDFNLDEDEFDLNLADEDESEDKEKEDENSFASLEDLELELESSEESNSSEDSTEEPRKDLP